MTSLRRLFQPLKDGTLRPSTPSRKPVSPNVPRAEDLVSPLKAELLTLVREKALRCSYHCTGCSQSVGGKCALDLQISTAVTTKDDPIPWAADVLSKMDRTVARIDKLEGTLTKTETKMQPIQTLRRAVYWGVGVGMFTLAVSVLKLVIGLP